jgi:membrane protease YdiL (CAAX protease family)
VVRSALFSLAILMAFVPANATAQIESQLDQNYTRLRLKFRPLSIYFTSGTFKTGRTMNASIAIFRQSNCVTEIDWDLSMWNRAPVLLRALLAAAAVTGTATVAWGVLIQSNLRLSPRLPWAAVCMAVFLVFYWRFLKGWGWPQSTTAARRASLRAEPLSALVWRWSLLAGGLGLAASIVLFIVSHRLIRWPQAPHSDLSQIPVITLLPSLLISAVVAGISEEAGFRGYMQGPLERRYGPAMGIAITSTVFGLAHLSHGAFLPAILFDIGWGSLFGLLTYWSGSIAPAIVLHSSADALAFVAAWKFRPTAPAPLVWNGGPDKLLWFNCVLVVLLGSASVWAFRRLARMRPNPSAGTFS